jgi:hypothetical protein
MSNGRCQRRRIVLSRTPPFPPLPARVQTPTTPPWRTKRRRCLAEEYAASLRQGGYRYNTARCWYAVALPQRRRRRGPGYRRRSGPRYRRRRRHYLRRRRPSRRGRCRGLRATVEFVARRRRRLRHRGRPHRFHAVPVRTKLPKEPRESAGPAPLSSRKNGLHITLLIFYTYYVHYCSYANYVN